MRRTLLHRILAMAEAVALCALLLIPCASPALAEQAEEPEEDRVYSRVIDVPGIGELPYYAQNDPMWGAMAYRPKRTSAFISMRVGGCGVTAVAMAVARQLSADELVTLAIKSRDVKKGFPICECSVNGYQHRSDEHEVFTPRTGEEYAQWLPAVIAGYAAGNNKRRLAFVSEGGGTKVKVCEEIADAYELMYRGSHDWDEVTQALQNGWSVVTTVSKGIFTTGSHFLCIAGVADGYIYILDPLMRDEYPTDKKKVLEIVEPGLVRAKEEDRLRLGLSGFYMMKRAN